MYTIHFFFFILVYFIPCRALTVDFPRELEGERREWNANQGSSNNNLFVCMTWDWNTTKHLLQVLSDHRPELKVSQKTIYEKADEQNYYKPHSFRT